MKTAVVTGAVLSSLLAPAFGHDAPSAFGRFGQSAASLSAISAGVALVTPCSAPLVFEEGLTESGPFLAIHCRGGEDDEASVIVRFADYGGVLVPVGFDLAG